MDARREYESRLAREARTEAYRVQRTEAASARFTRDDAGMAYGVDGASEHAATAWLNEHGYQWNGTEPRDDDAAALGGYAMLPDSAPVTDADVASVGGDWTYDGTLTPITYHAENLPALMRERPDGVNPSDHNKFMWRLVARTMTSDTLGTVNPRLVTLGGRNRRDGRNLVRTALAVGCDGAVLRVINDASVTTAAYAYALDTARAMRKARLEHTREQSRTDRAHNTTGRAARHARTRAVVDAHAISADLTAMLERARVGTSER